MRPNAIHIFLVSAGIALFGAGCSAPLVSPKIAEPLVHRTDASLVARDNGFGALPALPVVTGRSTVVLPQPLPTLPSAVTVIRLHQGDPNDTQIRNISAALGVPAGILGTTPTKSALSLEWSDESGYRWSYNAADHQLEFNVEKPLPGPLTVSALPSNIDVIRTANEFLQLHGIRLADYRDAVIDPDWNNWWLRASTKGLCMDTQSLFNIRAIASSVTLVAGNPPPIPESKKTTCVSPEFPSKLIIRYHALVDDRDVLTSDGRYVNGVELIADVTTNAVVSGRIWLYVNPDRSDYTARTADDVKTALLRSGTGVGATNTLTSYSFASMRIDESKGELRTTYLVPSIVASGIRTNADGSMEPVTSVIPLLKQ